MKDLIVCCVICSLFLPVSPLYATVLFSDSYDRADNTDIDASNTGMDGTLAPLVYQESYEGSGTVTSIQILSSQLTIAYGAGMSCLYLDHNFIDAGILTEGGFSVSLNIVEINSVTTDISNRFAGFGVGMTQAEAAAAKDINDHPTTMRGGGEAAGICDFFVDLALDGNVRLWSRGTLLSTISVGTTTGVLKAVFSCTNFNAGGTVTAVVFFNDVQRDTKIFTWSDTSANYIGISGRASNYAVCDNLNIASEVIIPTYDNIIVSETDGDTSVREGGYSDELNLSITSNPFAYPVTIDILDRLNPNQVTITPSQITFTSGNWQNPQTVTIAAIDDNDMERETHDTSLQFIVTVDAASPYYGYLLSNLSVDIHDNDCGTWAFHRADFNLDCRVDLEDFVYFAEDWILAGMIDSECDNCVLLGFNLIDFDMNCQLSLDDFSAFAQEWDLCSFPEAGCQDCRY